MPQSVYGSGCVPLKARSKAKIVKLAKQFDGWLEWDQFEFHKGRLNYAYNDIVTVGTAGDLDDFLEEIAAKYAAEAWVHYGDDNEISYHGPDDRARLRAELNQLEAEARTTEDALAAARMRLGGLNEI